MEKEQMEEKKRIFLKGKLWVAGTNTLVFGISKRDQETHGLKANQVIQVEILEVYDNTQLSKGKANPKERGNTGKKPVEVKSSLDKTKVSAPAIPNKSDTRGKFNIA